MSGRITIRVGKIAFQATDFRGAISWIVKSAEENRSSRRGVAVRLANAYCVALAENDREYADLLTSGGVNFPDGMPVIWAMRWAARGTGLDPRRVRGPSFFNETISAGVSAGLRHYFLGTTDGTLRRLEEEVHRTTPGAVIAGAFAPPFGPITVDWANDTAKRILETDPDIIWVALGTPKQDFASALLAQRTQRYCIGVGAAFDFTAGTVREAPRWMQRVGLEWFFRLASEPRRLGRRYFIGNVQFIAAALRHSPSSRRAALSRVDEKIPREAPSQTQISEESTVDLRGCADGAPVALPLERQSIHHSES